MKAILCPVDFSESSYVAARWAAQIASSKNFKLVLFHKFLISEVMKNADKKSGDLMDIARDAAEAKLNDLRNTLCKQMGSRGLQCSIFVEYGVGFEDMVFKLVKDAGVSLIVMGAEGADELSDILLGSHASHIISKTEIPVIIIPEAYSHHSIPNTIIYATDLKDESEEVISQLLEFSNRLVPNMILLNLAKDNKPNMSEVDSMTHRLISSNKEYENYFNLKTEAVESKDFFNDIQKYAKEHNALIAMGKHPKGFWEFLSEGSFTRLLSLYSFFPMIIFHKKD